MLTSDRVPAAPARRHRAATKSWPVVRGHRLTGVMRQIQFQPLELYSAAWREHGDYVALRALPGFLFYLIAHPDGIEHVLHGNLKNYRKPDSFNHAATPLVGKGILTSEGDFWRRQRRLVQPAFLKNSVTRLSGHMVDSIASFVDEWEHAGAERTIDVLPEMMRLALRIASTSLFSTDISGEADSIGQSYRTTFEWVSLKMNARLMFQPLWLPTRRNREFRRAKALLDRVILELVARRRREAPQHDVLGLLLAAQDEDTGVGMSDEQLKDEALTLLTAGHETTGAALSWCWYLLGAHPEIQEQFHAQVASHLQGRLPTAEELPQIPLATAIFEESMRLYPPAWGMPRESIEADVIAGYPLPARSTLILSQHLIHRHPAFWERPDEFDPARFLPGQSASRAKFAFFPFGGGPRHLHWQHLCDDRGPARAGGACTAISLRAGARPADRSRPHIYAAPQARRAGRGAATMSDKRERIVLAAVERFLYYGIAKTTMQEVAADARVAVGTLYLYFKNKDDLVVACAAEFVARHRHDAEEILASKLPPAEKLRRYILARFRAAEEIRTGSRHAVELTRAVLRLKPDRLVEEGMMMWEIVAQILRQGVAGGKFVIASTDDDAKIFLMSTAYFFPHALNEPPIPPTEADLLSVVNWFLGAWERKAPRRGKTKPAKSGRRG